LVEIKDAAGRDKWLAKLVSHGGDGD
jgi:hypothetical protein